MVCGAGQCPFLLGTPRLTGLLFVAHTGPIAAAKQLRHQVRPVRWYLMDRPDLLHARLHLQIRQRLVLAVRVICLAYFYGRT